MRRRQATAPHALLATATHDHKRGEDVRARLAVLSERPRDWNARLGRWLDAAERLGTGGMPDRADIAMLLQTVVGSWPFELVPEDAVGRAAFAERLEVWQQKALREAKRQTDWSDPNEAYETAARTMLHRLVVEDEGAALRTDLFAFVQEIASAGAINGLSQTLLRLTVPGVPDLFQGTELWDLSLVDPDNRRPVDYALRQTMLGADSLASWRDGGPKQTLIVRALGLRAALPTLFADGSYEPIAASGPAARHVVAFMRRRDADALLVVVPRLAAGLRRTDEQLAFGPAALADTTLALPGDLAFASALDDRSAPLAGAHAALQQIWRRWPVALFSTRRP
jgi:(1->4)-alpha-D-glucan 1-alpha-D-glucosylmutase